MAGFPFFQLDRFLKILVQDLNKHVAISEEFPAGILSKAKSGGLLFDRRVARVITPGTLIDEKFIDPYKNNFLLAVHMDQNSCDGPGEWPSMPAPDPYVSPQNKVGLAWMDLSTGDFFTQVTTTSLLPSAIARIGAREIILDQGLSQQLKQQIQALVGDDHHLLTYYVCENAFLSMSSWNSMLEAPMLPDSDSIFTIEEKLAGHRLLDYVRNSLQGLEMKLLPPSRKRLDETMAIDRSSLRGLEILESARDGLGRGSLLHTVKRTTTKSGARLLRDRLTSPSSSLDEINRRLDMVALFLEDSQLKEETVQLLRRSYDVQRLVQKFSLNKGDADDMICLARAIEASRGIKATLRPKLDQLEALSERGEGQSGVSPIAWLLHRIDIEGPFELAQRILSAIDEDALSRKHRLEEDEAASVAALAQEVISASALPDEIEKLPKKLRSPTRNIDAKDHENEIDDPWIMCKTASDTLVRLHNDLDLLRQEKTYLANSLRERLLAPSLTLKWTPGLGYICHVKASVSTTKLEEHHARVVQSTKTTKSLYMTEWTRLGTRLDQAKLHIRSEEQRLFGELRHNVIKNLVKLRRNAAVIDELDVASSFATLANEQSFVRPDMNMGMMHKIVGGRHPTVTLGLAEQGRSFISNDLVLGDEQRIWLVTGPNMGGKSTFLRQNALISILAQVGSYIPAQYAEIGIVDQIFSRIGAADDLFRDQSTFMVEMLETAAILKYATPRSFVIMDEVGRGTTPEDGTAIGFACLHHLYHVNKCRALFATHFHSLADLSKNFDKLGRYCTDVLEDDAGSFSFLHRIRPGVNRQSHALKVARLAGLPESALLVAKDVLDQIVDGDSAMRFNDYEASYETPLLSATAG